MDIGSAVGRAKGLSAEKIAALGDWRTSPIFSELERDALELTDHLAGQPVDVPDALYARLRGRLSEAQLLELTSAIAWENYRSRFNRVFGMGSDGFSGEGVCVLPARRRPDALPPG